MSGAQIDLSKIPTASLASRSYAAGEDIIEAGSAPANEMFIVKRGRVSIRLDGKLIEEVGPGGLVGELALLDRGARSAEAAALEPTEVLPVNERLFVILVQESPTFAVDVMRVLAARLRRMNDRQ